MPPVLAPLFAFDASPKAISTTKFRQPDIFRREIFSRLIQPYFFFHLAPLIVQS